MGFLVSALKAMTAANVFAVEEVGVDEGSLNTLVFAGVVPVKERSVEEAYEQCCDRLNCNKSSHGKILYPPYYPCNQKNAVIDH